jgi:hypothetical protein
METQENLPSPSESAPQADQLPQLRQIEEISQAEFDTITERKMRPCRPCFIAKLRGKKYEIYLGADGQLWRMVTLEECALGINPEGREYGQYTIASGPVEVFNFCKNFGLPSPERDRMLEMIAWKHSKEGFWQQLVQEFQQHGKYL